LNTLRGQSLRLAAFYRVPGMEMASMFGYKPDLSLRTEEGEEGGSGTNRIFQEALRPTSK